MSKLTDAEYKIRKYKETVANKLITTEANAKRYGSQFVRTNKQEDRHSAMKFTAVAIALGELLKDLRA